MSPEELKKIIEGLAKERGGLDKLTSEDYEAIAEAKKPVDSTKSIFERLFGKPKQEPQGGNLEAEMLVQAIEKVIEPIKTQVTNLGKKVEEVATAHGEIVKQNKTSEELELQNKVKAKLKELSDTGRIALAEAQYSDKPEEMKEFQINLTKDYEAWSKEYMRREEKKFDNSDKNPEDKKPASKDAYVPSTDELKSVPEVYAKYAEAAVKK